ncbi:hypothetical protein E2562_019830 [Oryza meyeriana var. granulata]|uniref:Uncharacterized protein n=1 Tax=Oryza meyeriana var. granulata TaxID=110450 RepID=A0A6G1CRZ1_9ORYZ|nr:hypothetical protein E2562_019830 [Oryza meyeriana var. granulata]
MEHITPVLNEEGVLEKYEGSARLGGGDGTTLAKQSLQVRQVVAAMEAMEERIMEAMKALTVKVSGVEVIKECLDKIDLKLEKQGERLDRVQAKVDMSMESLGQVQQELGEVTRVIKGVAVPPPLVISPLDVAQFREGASTSYHPMTQVLVPA